MEMEGERPTASNDIIVVPRGGGGGGGRSRGPRNETFVSAIEGGEYINLYPSDDQNEVMEKWPLGVDVSVQYKNALPDYLILQEAEQHQGHTLRKKKRGGQRQHVSIPTAAFRAVRGTVAGVAVESWTAGKAFCVRIAHLYGNGSGRQA